MKVSVGEQAPTFTLPDQDGQEWSLHGQRGKPVVLYFYPKDDTPGCTTQACAIRDNWEEFGSLGVEVVGISPDSVEEHQAFAAKYELPHRLLADPDRQVIEEYGVWGTVEFKGNTYEAVVRSSVVIDGDGNIVDITERIVPEDQADTALATVQRIMADARGSGKR